MKSQQKVIGEYTYQVTQVSASVGLEAAARLANIMGPGFSVAPDEGGLNGMGLGRVIGQIIGNPRLAPELAWFVTAFGKLTQVGFPDGRTSKTLADIYEEHFRGEIANQLQWLYFAFEVNMESFFETARKLYAAFRASQEKARTDSKSQTSAEGSGPSGA
jgi:hypothetical protein